MALPDTSEFTIKKARTRFTPDYVGAADGGLLEGYLRPGLLRRHRDFAERHAGGPTLLFTGYVNGSLAESQIEAVYINLAHRINWAVGAGQEPYFYREATEIRQATTGTEDTLVTNVRRLILRSAFAEGYYPLNRFRRIEAGLRVANVSDDRLSLVEPFDGLTGLRTADPKIRTQDLGSSNYVQPSLALVFDNSLNGYVGPFFGKRYRLVPRPERGHLDILPPRPPTIAGMTSWWGPSYWLPGDSTSGGSAGTRTSSRSTSAAPT
jgi:hypothetical protein